MIMNKIINIIIWNKKLNHDLYWFIDQNQTVSTQGSLRELRRLLWVDTFCSFKDD